MLYCDYNIIKSKVSSQNFKDKQLHGQDDHQKILSDAHRGTAKNIRAWGSIQKGKIQN